MTLYDFNSELSATIANEVEKLRKTAGPASPILSLEPGQQQQQFKAAEAFKAAVTETTAAPYPVTEPTGLLQRLLNRTESNIATGALGLCIVALVGYVLYVMYMSGGGGMYQCDDKTGEEKNTRGGPYLLNRLKNRVAFIEPGEALR